MGDVAGFAAATYLRGVRLVHVPTTVVAQVDSAIGGRRALICRKARILSARFILRRLVIADSELLRTLPHREYRSGLYEVVKYGVIADAELFGFSKSACPRCCGAIRKPSIGSSRGRWPSRRAW